MDETIRLVRDLVAIDSVNPSLVSGGAGETEICRSVAEHLKHSGLDVVSTEILPGRQNVVGLLTGREAGPTLMLCGHTDTVGVEGMNSPFDPIVRDGKIYGRGSGDMKGGLAAILEAARTLAGRSWRKGQLIVAAVADEEFASIGAEALVNEWSADAAIIGEPTGLTIATGHKGFSWIEITTTGRAAHGSRPFEGRDAIFDMGKVLHRLESLNRGLVTRTPHPLLGRPSLHASLVEGGREWCTYPDRCVLKIERRNVNGEPGGIALAEVEDILASLRMDDPEFNGVAQLVFDRSPYETPPDSAIPMKLESALHSCGHEARQEAMTYWTDAAILGEAGIPTVIFGPGGEGFHGLEEFVWADQVTVCRDALVQFASDFCS